MLGLADVQLKNGYTKLANEILERMALIKLSPIQYRLIFLIWRYTYGFNRKEHVLSQSFLSEATQYDARQIRRELQKLEQRKVIIQKVSQGRARVISFNKNYDEWIYEETEGKTTPGNSTLSTRGKTTPGTWGNSTPEEIKNLKKNLNINSSSEEVFKFYSNNLQIGVSSSPFVYEVIEHWINDMGTDLVLAAMKVSAKKEIKGFDYSEGILKRWDEAKVKTLEDARKHEREFKKSPRKAKTKKQKEDFDLND